MIAIGNKKWNRTDRINAIIAIGTIVAALGSIAAIIIAVVSLNLTKKSINEADATSQEVMKLTKQSTDANTLIANTSKNNYELAKIQSQRSDSISNINLELTEKSLGETEKNFSITNKPYIILTGFIRNKKDSTIKMGDTLKEIIQFVNFGKLPAVIYYVKCRFQFDTSKVLTNFYYRNIDSTWTGLTLPPYNPFARGVNPIIVTPMHYVNMFAGKEFLYLHGEMQYMDIINQKKSIYYFCIRINLNGSFLNNPVHNFISDYIKLK